MQSLPKSLFVFVFCIPLAVVFGVMLGTPLDQTSLLVIGTGFFLLLLPILLVHHKAFLVLSINAYVNAYFLPGQPQLWLIATAISCFFVILTKTLNRSKFEFLNVSSITWSLILFFLATFVTAQLTGGAGSRSLGSGQYGGRRYFYLWGAIAAYFAISVFPIPLKSRNLFAAFFFLSGITSVVGNLAYTLGPNFYFLYLLFPPENALFQALGEDPKVIMRITGLAGAAIAIVCYMLMRFGVRGLLDLKRFWRLAIIFVGIGLGLYSGYRWLLVIVAIMFMVQFILEGLHKTGYLVIAVALLVLVAGALVLSSNRLPLSLQRCLTIFPLDLDPSAIEDARGSTEWRLEMWRAILPDVPHYFWLGKGFAIDPKDLYFAQEGYRLGGVMSYEGAIVAGDYHSGPLTLIIPFGIWGVLTFTAFIISSLRVLWKNYKYSEPDVLNLNRFLLCYFISKLLFFIFIFGSLYLDLLNFTATVAFSISLNRGVKTALADRPVLETAETQAEPEMAEAALQPA
jgi:hypothetical protein